MMTPPLISIITITYNASATLPPTLESIKQQTYRNFEHLIIDGASTDNTVDIAKAYGTCRIISEPDAGLYDAMNKGLRLAKGKYVIFLNAGDSFASDDTLSHYAEAATALSPDIIYGDTDLVNDQRKVIGHRHFMVPNMLTKKSFADGMAICHQAFMARRAIAPMYDTKYRFSADYDWCVRCMEQASLPQKAVNLHRVTIHYLSEGLTTRNHRRSLRERFRIMCGHYGVLPTMMRHIRKMLMLPIKKLRK